MNTHTHVAVERVLLLRAAEIVARSIGEPDVLELRALNRGELRERDEALAIAARLAELSVRLR